MDEREISAEVMAELLMDDTVSTWKMFEQLECIHDNTKYDKETLDKVLRTLVGFDFNEIKDMVEERIKVERTGELA